jgi:hypothetical protein
MLPDGRRFLFSRRSNSALALAARAIGSLLDNDAPTLRFPAGAQAAVFAPPNHLLFVRGGVLFADRFDPQRLELAGERPTRLRRDAPRFRLRRRDLSRTVRMRERLVVGLARSFTVFALVVTIQHSRRPGR